MIPHRFIPILALVSLTLSACTHELLPGSVYSAVIERVEDVPGKHYTVTKGETPLSCIHLRLIGSIDEDRGRRQRLFVLGLYRPDILGEKGDLVSFRLVGELPPDGRIWIEQLSGYRVAFRGKTNLLPVRSREESEGIKGPN